MSTKLKTLISLFIIILFSLKSSAQNWPKIFTLNKYTLSRDLIQDYDNGSLLLGNESSNSTFSGYGFLIKTDVNGETLWIRFFGTDEYNVGFNDIKKTSDNGYLLSGWTDKIQEGYWDPLFLKLNTCGDIEWCTILNSELGDGSDYAVDAVELADGSIIGLLRYYGYQIETIRISLIKMDDGGNPLWIKHLAQEDPTIYNEEGCELLLTADSSLLVTGDLPGYPYFIKTDLLANELWSLIWEAEGGSHAITLNSLEDIHGNYYSTGALNSVEHPRMGAAILKTDKNGNQLYHKNILGDTALRGGLGPFEIYRDSLLIMGGGWSPVNHPIEEGYISVFITDTLGNLVKMRNLIDYYITPNGLEITNDDKIVTSGTFYEAGKVKTFLWKLNMQLEDDSINNNTIIYDSLCDHEISTDTLDINCGIYVNIDELPSRTEYESPIKLWPNPANREINISVTYSKGSVIILYNNEGKVVEQLDVPHDGNINVNISTFAKGLYYVRLLNNKRQLNTRKFIVE